MLRARVLGLRTSIFVAAVEMGGLRDKVRETVGCPGRPQLVMCIGYMARGQKPTAERSEGFGAR